MKQQKNRRVLKVEKKFLTKMPICTRILIPNSIHESNGIINIQSASDNSEEHSNKETTGVPQDSEESKVLQEHLSEKNHNDEVVPNEDMLAEPIPNPNETDMNQNEEQSVLTNTDQSEGQSTPVDQENVEQTKLGDQPIEQENFEQSTPGDQSTDQENNDTSQLLSEPQEKDEEITKLKNTIIDIESRKNQTISDLQKEIEVLKEEKVRNQTSVDKKEDPSNVEEISITQFMQEGFQKLEKKVNEINGEFASKLKYDESKDKIIDNLHRELQTYKDDQIKKIKEPVIHELIIMADRTKKLIQAFDKEEELYPQKLIRVIKDSFQDIEDALYRQSVISYNCEGDTYDAKRQQIIKVIKIDDVSKDKKVAEVVGNGYEWNGKIFRAEKVNIYQYEGPKTAK